MRRISFLVIAVVVLSTRVLAAQAPTFMMQWPVPGQPWAIQTGPDGNLWISLATGNAVQEYTPTGALLFGFGSAGAGAGQFNGPRGVGFGPSGQIYVVDTVNRRVQHFTASGGYIEEWRAGTNDPDQAPQFTWVDSYGCTYTSVPYEGADIHCPGCGPCACFCQGDYMEARQHGIAFDGHYFYQSDYLYNRIFKIDPYGDLIQTWGTGLGPDQVAVDQAGLIWVACRFSHDIRVYSANGDLQFKFGTLGSEPGQFIGACGIAIGKDGLIYVADQANQRVMVFGYAVPTKMRTWGSLKSTYR